MPSSILKEIMMKRITNNHLFFFSKKFRKIQASDEGMNVNERISPSPGFVGDPKSIKSKTLRINASMNHVAKPTIQNMIYNSVQLILFLGIRIRVSNSATTTAIGNHSPFAPRSKLSIPVASMVSPPNITKISMSYEMEKMHTFF